MDISEKITQPGLSKHFYGNQLRKYITQFMAVFYDMKVSVGKNDFNSQSEFIHIPIVYGSMDRVVASIKSSNTQNKNLRVPMLSTVISGIELSLDRMVGTNTHTRDVRMKLGGDIKTDLYTVEKLRPLPYKITFQLSIYASNSDQHFQMLEQILTLFDPTLQLQTSDTFDNWAKIYDIRLESIDLRENNPPESSKRMIITDMTFSTNGYLSVPADVKNNVITKIKLRVEEVATNQSIQERLADTLRPEPPYITIYDIDEEDIPKN